MSLKVLIVHDDPKKMGVLSGVLKNEGYDIITASN
jgi:CheY-like chemotaxis protein